MSSKRPDLSVRIGDVELSNPVIAASGTFGYGGEFSEIMDLSQLGGIVVKGLSMHVERGNAPPRIVETSGGMLNSIGLQNVGAAKGLTALELNISCPNIKEGGINFGTDPKQTEQVTRAVREASSLPLWVKLTPGVTDIGELARAAEAGGADALSVINTLRGMTIDVPSRRPTLSTIFGGLSGPAILPIALYMVYETRRATNLPILGIGGIEGLDQALQFFILGANAVQVGTANFYDPMASIRLVEDLRDWCETQGILSINELVGSLECD